MINFLLVLSKLTINITFLFTNNQSSHQQFVVFFCKIICIFNIIHINKYIEDRVSIANDPGPFFFFFIEYQLYFKKFSLKTSLEKKLFKFFIYLYIKCEF